MAYKGGTWSVCKFKGGGRLDKKEGFCVFEAGGVKPQCILWRRKCRAKFGLHNFFFSQHFAFHLTTQHLFVQRQL